MVSGLLPHVNTRTPLILHFLGLDVCCCAAAGVGGMDVAPPVKVKPEAGDKVRARPPGLKGQAFWVCLWNVLC